jgi:hypothetical protein
MEENLLGVDVSRQTHDSILAQISTPKAGAPVQGNKTPSGKPPDANMIGGLLLGSPEFQRK